MWSPKQDKVRKPQVSCLYFWIFSMRVSEEERSVRDGVLTCSSSERQAGPEPFIALKHIQAQLSTPVGSKPQSRVCEPVFPLSSYAGWGLLFFCWYQQHFEFQLVCVAVEGRSSDVLNMHAQLQISLLMRFLSILHQASQCAFGDGVHWLFFSLFAQFKNSNKIS